jgi:hypothetical protein
LSLVTGHYSLLFVFNFLFLVACSLLALAFGIFLFLG